MTPENLTIQSLEKLMKLIRRKKQIETEVSKVDAQISALLGGAQLPSLKVAKVARKAKKAKGAKKVKRGKRGKRGKRSKRGKRGSLGKKVLGALAAAGSEGISVPELSAKTGIKAANLHAWFATTGKKLVERVARGRYRVKQAAQAQQHEG